jgi:hypothetical protein
MTKVLPVSCARCDGTLDLQVVDWDPTIPSTRQRYRCPECKEVHDVELPGQIVLVARRIVPRVPLVNRS